MKQFNCKDVASSEKRDLTIFCNVSQLWCPIRVMRMCVKRQSNRIQLTTNVMFDPQVFVPDDKEVPQQSQGTHDVHAIKVISQSRRNLRYRRRQDGYYS